MQSTTPRQGGRDVPGAMPGLMFRSTNRIVKQHIPGMSPVIQNLGVESLTVTLVGCFTGDGGLKDGWGAKSKNPSKEPAWATNMGTGYLFLKDGCYGQCPPPGSKEPTINRWAALTPKDKTTLGDIAEELDAYSEYTSFFRMSHTLAKEMEVEINVRRNYDGLKAKTNPLSPITSPLRSDSGNPKFKAYVKRCDAYLQYSDRVWYIIELEVSDHGIPSSKEPLNLTNVVGKSTTASSNSEAQPSEAKSPQSNLPEGNAGAKASGSMSQLPSQTVSPPTPRLGLTTWEDTPRSGKHSYKNELNINDTDYIRSTYNQRENIERVIRELHPTSYIPYGSDGSLIQGYNNLKGIISYQDLLRISKEIEASTKTRVWGFSAIGATTGTRAIRGRSTGRIIDKIDLNLISDE